MLALCPFIFPAPFGQFSWPRVLSPSPSSLQFHRSHDADRSLPPNRLRQTDVKAGHFERKVQALESERDQWESKYEEMSKKYADIKKELEEFQAEIGNI